MRAHLEPAREDAPPALKVGPSPAGPADAADAWLALLVRLLRWPAREAGPVREELETHLRERIRDLMLAGAGEDDAVRRAVAELGEAAAVAQRYRSARRYPQRRLMMNAAMFALAGAALGLSIVAVSGGTGGGRQPAPRALNLSGLQPAERSVDLSGLQPAGADAILLQRALDHLAVSRVDGDAALIKQYQEQIDDLKAREKVLNDFLVANLTRAEALATSPGPEQPAKPALRVSVFQPTPATDALAGKKITGQFQGVPLSDVTDYIVQWAGMPGIVQWRDLEASGVMRDTGVSLDVKDVPFGTFLGLLGDAAGTSTGLKLQLDYRVSDGHLEIGSVQFFDQHEIELVSYDLSRLPDDVGTDAIPGLIMTFVDPTGWKDNGGQSAELKIVGPRMFIQAPRRYHRQIEWLLGELARPGEGHTQAAPAGSRPAGSRDDGPDQVVQVYPLKHIDATEAVGLVRGRHALASLGPGDVIADAHTNSLIVRSSAEQVRLVGQVLDELDRPAEKKGSMLLQAEGNAVAANVEGSGTIRAERLMIGNVPWRGISLNETKPLKP